MVVFENTCGSQYIFSFSTYLNFVFKTLRQLLFYLLTYGTHTTKHILRSIWSGTTRTMTMASTQITMTNTVIDNHITHRYATTTVEQSVTRRDRLGGRAATAEYPVFRIRSASLVFVIFKRHTSNIRVILSDTISICNI